MTTDVKVSQKTRGTYVVLACLLGCLGIHNFYAGYTGKAVAQLLISLFIGWLIVPIIAVLIWVIIEMGTVVKDGTDAYFCDSIPASELK